jgi:hypothetical protein
VQRFPFSLDIAKGVTDGPSVGHGSVMSRRIVSDLRGMQQGTEAKPNLYMIFGFCPATSA